MTTILALTALAAPAQSTHIDAYLQPGFHDASFVAHVVQKDEKELMKINDDFGQSYRFERVSFRLKEPFMVRGDANVEDTTVTYVVNGTARRFRVPRLRLNTKQDLSKKPGNRQTAMDFGILTPAIMENFLDAKFVRVDRATGDAVFDLTYKSVFNDKTRYRVWMDPQKRYIAKREWYHRTGRMVATFLYDDPVTQDGVTVPTKQTAKNGDDRVAGTIRYEGMKLNGGIPDDVFEIK